VGGEGGLYDAVWCTVGVDAGFSSSCRFCLMDSLTETRPIERRSG
jgi:hypothetical protein